MSINLHAIRIDKGNIDKNSLVELLSIDNDFLENVEYFRPDTLELGFENEAERVSEEIFDKFNDALEDDESYAIEGMFQKVVLLKNFVTQSSTTKSFDHTIVETDFEYILILALDLEQF